MKTLRSAAPNGLFRRRGRCAGAAVMLAAALASAQALAGATVGSHPASITVDAQNISIAEILAALGHDFNVHSRSAVPLNRQITGKYEGSVQRVVTRILQGYNFVVESRADGVEVMVFGTQTAPMQSAGESQAMSCPICGGPARFLGARPEPRPPIPPGARAAPGPLKMQLSDVTAPGRPFPMSAADNAAAPPSPGGSRHLSIQYGGGDGAGGGGHAE